MESLRALASNGIPIEFKQVLHYTIIVFACLSMFRTTRRWILFVIRAIWCLGFECGVNYFLQYCYRDDWSDAILGRRLDGSRHEREPMSWGEMWYAMWGYRTKKQMLRSRNRDMVKNSDVEIRYGLVVPNGKRLLDDEDLRVAKAMRRRSWGIIEYEIQPVEQDSGAVQRNSHSRGDSGGSFSSAIDNAEGYAGRTELTGTIGRKRKNKNRR